MTPLDWLPSLVLLSNYNGDWEIYKEALYGFYSLDFIENQPIFRNERLKIKKYPKYKNKDATFWHIIEKGKIEDDRLPDLRRCERIRWPKPIIENCDNIEIYVWENQRKGKQRICILYKQIKYLVILEKRRHYIIFWTAYPVEKDHTVRKLVKEYERYLNNQASPQGDDTATPSTHGR